MMIVDSPSIAPESGIAKGSVEGWRINSYILGLRFNGPEMGIDDVRDSQELRERLMDGQPCYALTDLRNVRHTSAEARHTSVHDSVKRLAILYRSPVGRMLGNAYLHLKRTHCPIRLFNDKSKALRWLDAGPPTQP
jgi:hypothetical protein